MMNIETPRNDRRFNVVDDFNITDRIRRGLFDDSASFDLKTQAEYLCSVRDVGQLFFPAACKARLYPHQIAAAHKVITEIKIGGLLADEVGLGKTIEAGMIIKEYLCRRQAQRILILTPASLAPQWKEELASKFSEHFEIYNQKTRRALDKAGRNIWAARDRIICSLDTAKKQRYRNEIAAVNWDIVVVDEAHKLKNRKTENYRLLESLRKTRLLLLTATPLQNKEEDLYNLISLIDDKLLGSQESFAAKFPGDARNSFNTGNMISSYNAQVNFLKQRLPKIMIRTRRKDAIGVKFTQRFGETVQFELTPEERQLYDAVTSYVKQEYLKATQQNKTVRGFLLAIMQRMTSSSSFAIRDSLSRRIQHLTETIEEHPTVAGNSRSSQASEEDQTETSESYELSLDDDEREHIIEEHEKTDTNNLAKNSALAKLELEKLVQLQAMANKISKNSKGEQLVRALETINREDPNAKVLIYTEFRATQRYLKDLLTCKGYKIAEFNGSMSVEEKDEQVADWKQNKQLMISTECGGEGRNFQFCHIMFNYDLPWNPMRIEQRIGRIHRINQEHNVKIFNFSTKDTIEEYVLELLETKIDLFREVIGELDLILGEIAEDGNLERIIMEILARAESAQQMKEDFAELGRKISKARKDFEESLSHLDKEVYSGFDLSVYRQILGDDLDKYTANYREATQHFFLKYLRTRNVEFWHRKSQGELIISRMPQVIRESLERLEDCQHQFFLKEKKRFYELLDKPRRIADDIRGFVHRSACNPCGLQERLCHNCEINRFLQQLDRHAAASHTSALRKDLDHVSSPVFRLHVQKKMRRNFSTKATFSPKVSLDKNIELIAIGSSTLETAIKECKERGFTAKKLVDLNKCRLKGFERYRGVRGILFNLKISLESFDDKDRMVPILIDLDRMKYAEALSNKINLLDSTDLQEVTLQDKEVDTAYRLAQDVLNRVIEKDLAQTKDKNRSHYESELAKTEAYYEEVRLGMIMKERELEDEYIWRIDTIRSGRHPELEAEYREKQRRIESQLARLRNKNNKVWEKMIDKRTKELAKLKEQYDTKTKVTLLNCSIVKMK